MRSDVAEVRFAGIEPKKFSHNDVRRSGRDRRVRCNDAGSVLSFGRSLGDPLEPRLPPPRIDRARTEPSLGRMVTAAGTAVQDVGIRSELDHPARVLVDEMVDASDHRCLLATKWCHLREVEVHASQLAPRVEGGGNFCSRPDPDSVADLKAVSPWRRLLARARPLQRVIPAKDTSPYLVHDGAGHDPDEATEAYVPTPELPQERSGAPPRCRRRGSEKLRRLAPEDPLGSVARPRRRPARQLLEPCKGRIAAMFVRLGNLVVRRPEPCLAPENAAPGAASLVCAAGAPLIVQNHRVLHSTYARPRQRVANALEPRLDPRRLSEESEHLRHER